jgi:hypothetical protein
MSTDKERMELLLAHLKMNGNELAKRLGYKRSDRVYHVIKERNGISSSLARDICTEFDSINFDWLLKGEGDMVKSKTYTQIQPRTTIVMESAAPYGEPAEEEVNITEADTIIAMQRMMEIDRVRKMLIAEKDREIEALTKELEFWKAKANKLEYELSKTKTDTDTLQQEKAV